jgi:hypothetical protein
MSIKHAYIQQNKKYTKQKNCKLQATLRNINNYFHEDSHYF